MHSADIVNRIDRGAIDRDNDVTYLDADLFGKAFGLYLRDTNAALVIQFHLNAIGFGDGHNAHPELGGGSSEGHGLFDHVAATGNARIVAVDLEAVFNDDVEGDLLPIAFGIHAFAFHLDGRADGRFGYASHQVIAVFKRLAVHRQEDVFFLDASLLGGPTGLH